MALDRIGRYEIQRRLGTGGMGALYLARDPSLDRLVAIKLLRDDHQDNNDVRDRFAREARSVARLRHPNIVVVFDVGEDEGRPFMAMEYLAGETLTTVLRRNPPLPLVQRLGLMEDLCAGLAHAHSAGIVHRDVKPANIMLDSEGVLKVLDFGIARLGNSTMTQSGMMMGSVNYMSPEQILGRPVDHRCDIFAAGAVVYEAVTLEQAFPGGFDSGLLHNILENGPVPLEQRVPDVDPELAAIVRRALEREPDRRYQDVNAMRRDIARVRNRLLQQGPGSAEVPQDGYTTIVPRKKTTTASADSAGPNDTRARQIEEHLRLGREALAQGEPGAALRYAERAVTVDPANQAALELIDRARVVTEARTTARMMLAEARRLLAEGRLEDSSALAEKVAVALPDLKEGDQLRHEVQQASDEIAAARELEQIAKSRLQAARTQADVSQPTPSEAVRPQRRVSVVRLSAFAAILVTAIAVGVLLLRRQPDGSAQPARAVPAGDARPSTTATGPVALVPPPSAAEPAPPPSNDAPKAVANPSGNDEALEQRIAADRTRARRLLGRGQLTEALSAVQSILRLKSDDRDTRALLDSMATEASTAMRRAKDDAGVSGAPTSAARTYQAALEKEAAAERRKLSSQVDQALPLYWSARDQFAASAREARQAQARERATQEPPAGTARPDPPAPVAAAPPVRTEPPPQVNDRAAIEQTLRAYEAAWASRDVEAVRRVQEFSTSELARVRASLEAAREFRVSVQIQDIALAIDGRHATVTARVARAFTPKSSTKPVDNSTTNTFTMEKRDDRWVIVALR